MTITTSVKESDQNASSSRVQHPALSAQPRPLNLFEEVMPDVPGWPDAKSGYLLFTQGHFPYLEHARRAGWPSRSLAAGHFHVLVDPTAVAMTLVELMKQMNEKLDGDHAARVCDRGRRVEGRKGAADMTKQVVRSTGKAT